MSDLQIGLLAIGAVIVVVVLAYNKWQDLRYRRQAERSFGPGHDDVLLLPAQEAGLFEMSRPAAVPAATERIEPGFTADAMSDPDANDVLERATPAAELPAQKDEDAEDAGLSEALDYIVMFECGQPVQASGVIEQAVRLLAKFVRPVHIEGWDEADAAWKALGHGHAYGQMRAGIQLADRRGMISSEELGRFARAVEELAVAIGAAIAPSDPAQGMVRAQALDQLCGEVDIQIALNIVATEGLLAGTKLRALAESAGMTLEGDGHFRRRDDAGRELFSLANGGDAPFSAGSIGGLATAAVTFEFDLPRSPGGTAAFDQLTVLASRFAQTLGGQLVDDNRAVLRPQALAAIRAQLEPVYAAMAAQGIPAGSPLALRLFS